MSEGAKAIAKILTVVFGFIFGILFTVILVGYFLYSKSDEDYYSSTATIINASEVRQESEEISKVVRRNGKRRRVKETITNFYQDLEIEYEGRVKKITNENVGGNGGYSIGDVIPIIVRNNNPDEVILREKIVGGTPKGFLVFALVYWVVYIIICFKLGIKVERVK